MKITPSDYLGAVATLIRKREQTEDKKEREELLKQLMWYIAAALRLYCKQQGNTCENCKFKFDDVDRKACECRINIGKNEPGTAPRFWELMYWRKPKDEKAEESMQTGLPGQEAGMP